LEPNYRKLFGDWNLPRGKATEVMAIIREREQNLISEHLRYGKEATLEVGDHTDRARVRASLDKAKAKLESALFVEQQQLLSILGPDRYQKLKDMEEKQKQAARKKAIAEETN
jgi:cation transport regulator ChaC